MQLQSDALQAQGRSGELLVSCQLEPPSPHRRALAPAAARGAAGAEKATTAGPSAPESALAQRERPDPAGGELAGAWARAAPHFSGLSSVDR